jgi:hypothetical protein
VVHNVSRNSLADIFFLASNTRGAGPPPHPNTALPIMIVQVTRPAIGTHNGTFKTFPCAGTPFQRSRARYLAYREAHGTKPLFYRGREKWTEIPKEFL